MLTDGLSESALHRIRDLGLAPREGDLCFRVSGLPGLSRFYDLAKTENPNTFYLEISKQILSSGFEMVSELEYLCMWIRVGEDSYLLIGWTHG